MTIEQIRDPKTRKEITYVSGKVEKIYFNKLKEVKTYSGNKGEAWTPTHSVSILVDGTRVGLGLTDKETLRAKAEDGKYHDVAEGMDVSIEIVKIGEYKGAPQYDSQTNKVYIADLSGAVAAPAKASEQKPASEGGFNKDTTGIETGHAINGAFEWLGGEAKSADYLETAKEIHAITVEMKEYYKATFPKASAYDAGAASGNAVLNALKIAKARDKGLDTVLTYAKTIVGNIAIPLSDYIRKSKEKPVAPVVEEASDDFEEEVAAVEEEVATPAPKPRGRPAKPKEAPVDDYDDSIPF